MKSIIIDNRELHYEICSYSGEYADHYYTKFYEGTYTKYRKKYFLFGPVIPIVRPRFIFDLWENIESPRLSREECGEKIKKALDKYDIKSNRITEIKKGELI